MFHNNVVNVYVNGLWQSNIRQLQTNMEYVIKADYYTNLTNIYPMNKLQITIVSSGKNNAKYVTNMK